MRTVTRLLLGITALVLGASPTLAQTAQTICFRDGMDTQYTLSITAAAAAAGGGLYQLAGIHATVQTARFSGVITGVAYVTAGGEVRASLHKFPVGPGRPGTLNLFFAPPYTFGTGTESLADGGSLTLELLRTPCTSSQ